ncbi:MAG: tetratricopeptide repeat protein [Flavobacteriales bacterium]|nr:tetratricopeptide repeat protein [Flavobacteriales bacterium]
MRTLSILSSLAISFTLMAQSADEAMIAGLTALKKEDHKTAQTEFDKVVVEEPTNSKAWYYRAVTKLSQGDNAGALQDLDQLLAMEPADVHGLIRRAEVNRAMGKSTVAKHDLYRVIGLHPNGPATEHALFELGRMAMEENDLPAALSHYDRLVNIASYNAMAWCDRGIALSVVRDDDRAIADLEKAVEMDPTLDKAYAALAVIYFRQDRKQDGCYALQQAHDLGDRSVEELMMLHCDR